MTTDIDKISNDIRRKNAVLWVCQRYDLKEDEEAHDWSTIESEAILKYRTHPNKIDQNIASVYWEAIWFESAKPIILECIKNSYESDTAKTRKPVILASDDDSKIELSLSGFLPISVLPGLIGNDIPESQRYGSYKKRVRDRIAFNLSSRLKKFDGRTIYVIGARDENDLNYFFEALEDVEIYNARVVIVSDTLDGIDIKFDNPGIIVELLNEGLESFSERVVSIGAPSQFDATKHTIYCKSNLVEIDAPVYDDITSNFYLLTSDDISSVQDFTLSDLYSFLECNIRNWKAYSIGLPVERSYEPDGETPFREFILNMIKDMDISSPDVKNVYVKLPAEGGSGSTTLLKTIAHAVATNGYPVLYANTELIDYDYESIISFLQHVSDQCKFYDDDLNLPSLIIFDKTSNFTSAKGLAQALRFHGKKAVIVECVSSDDVEDDNYICSNSFYKLKKIKSVLENSEVELCSKNFNTVIKAWNLPMKVPTHKEWVDFRDSTSWGDGEGTLFWIAIRYFLTEGLDVFEAEVAKNALGSWILRRYDLIVSENAKKAIRVLAVLSSYKIMCPMWTLTKYMTGSKFSTELLDTFKALNDLVVWGNFNTTIDDHTLYFLHPLLADELLRQIDIRSDEDKISTLTDFLNLLSGGRKSEVWLARMLCVTVFAVKKDNYFSSTDSDWRLKAFASIPAELSESDKTILHHWARCLYQSASSNSWAELGFDISKQRLDIAIDKLNKAIELPRYGFRDEHPSLLYNTLGTLHSRYASFLSEHNKSKPDIDEQWSLAYKSFATALSYSQNQDVTALITFAYRLIDRHKSPDSPSPEFLIPDLNDALYYIDMATELITDAGDQSYEHITEIESMKTDIYNLLKNEDLHSKIFEMQQNGDELGYYLEARIVSDDNDEKHALAAITILDNAIAKNIKIRFKFALLYLRLMSRVEHLKFDYYKQIEMYDVLETDPGYTLRPLDMFKRAVLSYQINDYDNGREQFRKLRSFIRRSDFPPVHYRDFWRDPKNPNAPRVTHLKVGQILSDWRAEGRIDDIAQSVPFRPRHFTPMPTARSVIECMIRFEMNGPIAVPVRFHKKQ